MILRLEKCPWKKWENNTICLLNRLCFLYFFLSVVSLLSSTCEWKEWFHSLFHSPPGFQGERLSERDLGTGMVSGTNFHHYSHYRSFLHVDRWTGSPHRQEGEEKGSGGPTNCVLEKRNEEWAHQSFPSPFWRCGSTGRSTLRRSITTKDSENRTERAEGEALGPLIASTFAFPVRFSSLESWWRW